MLCRSKVGANAVVLAGAVFVLFVAATWGYTQVFSARAALVHSGVLIGTIMAFNVFMVIIPNQKKVVAALLAGEAPDPDLGETARQRSLHNTYLTLPVLLLMVSGHYPMLTGHPHAWLLVALIIVGGGCARHFLVHVEVGRPFASVAWALPVVAVALAVAVTMTAPTSRDSSAAQPVSDVEVLGITDAHCVSCHANQPTHPAFRTAPKNIVLETTDDLRRYADLVDLHTVRTRTMPLGNLTGMTDVRAHAPRSVARGAVEVKPRIRGGHAIAGDLAVIAAKAGIHRFSLAAHAGTPDASIAGALPSFPRRRESMRRGPKTAASSRARRRRSRSGRRDRYPVRDRLSWQAPLPTVEPVGRIGAA